MLVTRQSHIPFLWLVVLTLPWALFYFMIQVNGVNFFILNRLIDNPAALTFFFSLPGVLMMFVPLGPYISFMSDRIWTRWGRRKIFLIINFTGAALVMFLYPLASNVWIFLALMCIGSVIGAFGTPFEALKLEIIPPEMRGRSAAMNTWVSTTINIVFSLAVIGRFDEVLPFLGGEISGIKVLYWTAAAALLIVVYNYLFGIHEVNPRSQITGERFTLRTAWTSITMPQLRYLYVFMVATTLLAASLGGLGTLLYINQWGYSFQEMGINIAVGGILNLFIIPAVGLFADKGRHHRMRIWLTCVALVTVLTASYFAYVTWYLPDQRPSLVEIIFFGETTCIISIIGNMVYYPLVYDYIPRNLMGTYSAGCGMISGLVGFLTTNGLGIFLMLWASLFQPPAGEMVRVCLAHAYPESEVAAMLSRAALVSPDGGAVSPSDIVARPWYANGIVADQGTCYEVRLRDARGEALMKQRDKIKSQVDELEAKLALTRKTGVSATKAARREQELEALSEAYTNGMREVDRRAEAWRREVVRGLGPAVMTAGTELLTNQTLTARVSVLPALRKASPKELDRLNRALQARDPAAVGVTVVPLGRGFGLSCAALVPPGVDPGQAMESILNDVNGVAAGLAPGLLAPSAKALPSESRAAVRMEIALVENPVRTFLSPISRAMNAVLSHFVDLPSMDQKLVSLGRNVCKGDLVSQARVTRLEEGNGVSLVLVAGTRSEGDGAGWSGMLLERIRTECASLKLTVKQPVVDQGVVPIKYNYMSGYLYVFMLVILGFSLVMFFLYKERKGAVRKWGAEEAEVEKSQRKQAQAEAQLARRDAEELPAAAPETYTPGYLWPKVLFALLGLVLMAAALQESLPNLRLVARGTRVEAVAVSAVARKSGQPDCLMGNQAELDTMMKTVGNSRDYAWTFYNQFAFEAADGREVTVRRAVGCKLKPSVPLVDENGLPSTVTLCYDPANPERTVLPLEYSTWLASALLFLLGVVLFFLSATLAWFARKPIVLNSAASVNLQGGK